MVGLLFTMGHYEHNVGQSKDREDHIITIQ